MRIHKGWYEGPRGFSQKRQSPKKIVEVMVGGKGKETNIGEELKNKEKHSYIAPIMERTHWKKNSSKSTMKRKLIDMMVVNKDK